MEFLSDARVNPRAILECSVNEEVVNKNLFKPVPWKKNDGNNLEVIRNLALNKTELYSVKVYQRRFYGCAEDATEKDWERYRQLMQVIKKSYEKLDKMDSRSDKLVDKTYTFINNLRIKINSYFGKKEKEGTEGQQKFHNQCIAEITKFKGTLNSHSSYYAELSALLENVKSTISGQPPSSTIKCTMM